MDIRKFAVEPIGRLHLCDASGEPMYADDEKTRPIAVNLYGPGSKQHARAQAAQQNRMLDQLKRKGKTEQSAEQKAADAAEFLAACTESFENMDYDGITGLTEALARSVYADKSIGFIADQAAQFIGDWANFTKASPTN